ncbi:MAG: sensor histidine kinase [Acidimicrobiia bacterium]
MAFAAGIAIGVVIGGMLALVVYSRGRGALTTMQRAVARSEEAAADQAASIGRFERVLETVPLGVVLTDPRGEIIYRNPSAKTVAGARHAEALVDEAVRSLVQGATAGKTERRNLEVYGPPRRTLSIIASPVMNDNDVIGSLALIEDISERSRLEAVRTDFVANVSHELKTPVGAVALLAETLVAEDDPAVVERLSQRLLAEAHRLSRIIDDLLELSRIEASGLDGRELIDMAGIVREALDGTRSAAEQAGIVLECGPLPSDAVVLGERRQLVSAVGNLLENAVKYSEAGSSVELEASVEDGTADGGPSLVIVVRDHGIGIPARDIERVFERFYRVDRARSRVTGGTGLGLAIVRHVVGNHSGTVSVTSKEGEGSAFTLRLPIVRADAAEVAP